MANSRITQNHLPEHLTEISKLVKDKKADLGFVVDPDVDRLAIINEDGSMFGEEYTLVAVADYVLSKKTRQYGFEPFIDTGVGRCY